MANTNSDETPILERRIRSRGYETDITRTIPIRVMLSYFEHLRWETMQYPPLGLGTALSEGHYFIVRAQTMELVRSVGQGHDLSLRAVLEKVGRSSAWVRHELVRIDDGALVAHSRVHGVWMGPSRRPARIPGSMRDFARRHVDALDALTIPARTDPPHLTDESVSFVDQPDVLMPVRGLDIAPPDVPPADADAPTVAAHERTILRSDIDVFGHVNAARYLDFFEDVRGVALRRSTWREALGASASAHVNGRIVRVSLIYLAEAVEGERVRATLWPLAPAESPGEEHEDGDGGRAIFGAELFSLRHETPCCRARIETIRVPGTAAHQLESD